MLVVARRFLLSENANEITEGGVTALLYRGLQRYLLYVGVVRLARAFRALQISQSETRCMAT